MAADFSPIPEPDKLKAVPRDLRFYPSEVKKPKTLTEAQIETFNSQGYLKPLAVFSPEEIADYRSYFDELLEKTLASGKDSYSISTAHLAHGRVYDLLTEPRIVAYVQDLLGENVVGWGSHFFCKMPGDGKAAPWHQDASYWPLTPSKTVTVWLAIDDASPENACMRFIPGSHHLGHLPFERLESMEHAVLDQEVANAEDFGDPVDVELKAGQISIHADLLLHGSLANDSTRRRCGLTLRYCAADVSAGLGWNEKGVVVSGLDRRRHWTNPKRPNQN